jgi:hypothetical protein
VDSVYLFVNANRHVGMLPGPGPFPISADLLS